ncbi:hypothetical protein JB92DRAFT_2832439 [Gautieria morchelliformis]|nr:hypothetical protein JB92DRAFT_2832439 [Gautieria morchelliformis]
MKHATVDPMGCTLGKFWDAHSGENVILLQQLPGDVKKIKNVGAVLSLEWYFIRKRWDPINYGLPVLGKKRARHSTDSGTGNTPFKKSVHGPLQSCWAPGGGGACLFQDDAGKWQVNWDNTNEYESAKIDNVHTFSGTMKHVYCGTFQEQCMVFKRFYDFVDGPENRDIAGNARFLTAEAQRLKIGQEILNAFYSRAKETDTLVSDVMGEKYRDDPSPASGIKPDDMYGDDDVVWLIEPFRGTVVHRWSGTTEHPWHEQAGLLGVSLYALAHFSLAGPTVKWSSQTYKVPSQGRLPMKGDGGPSKLGQIIFDHMFHSASGTSGVGDHGTQGIETYIAQHDCCRICEALEIGIMGYQKLVIIMRRKTMMGRKMRMRRQKQMTTQGRDVRHVLWGKAKGGTDRRADEMMK